MRRILENIKAVVHRRAFLSGMKHLPEFESAYGPMMAIFFTGISMGRTLRETVLGVYFFGCLSSFLFSVIFGGFSLYLQYTGQFDEVGS